MTNWYEEFGLKVLDTGGGCRALGKALPDGRYVLITDEGTDVPEYGTQSQVDVGVYESYEAAHEGPPLYQNRFDDTETLIAALRNGEAFAPPCCPPSHEDLGCNEVGECLKEEGTEACPKCGLYVIVHHVCPPERK